MDHGALFQSEFNPSVVLLVYRSQKSPYVSFLRGSHRIKAWPEFSRLEIFMRIRTETELCNNSNPYRADFGFEKPEKLHELFRIGMNQEQPNLINL